MRKFLTVIGSILLTVSCAAQTEKEISQGVSRDVVQQSQYSGLEVFRDLNSSQQKFRFGDYFNQPNSKKYVIYQFASTSCATCPDETKLVQQVVRGSNTADHRVILVTPSNEQQRYVDEFIQQAQISSNIMLFDRQAETIRLFFEKAFEVPMTLVMGKDGSSRVFKFDGTSNETPEQHIQKVAQELNSIIRQ